MLYFSPGYCNTSKPYELLGKIKSADIDFYLIDRTPFHENTDHMRSTVLKIFEANYPHGYSQCKNLKIFKSVIIEEFDSFEKLTYSKFKGFIICKQVPNEAW